MEAHKVYSELFGDSSQVEFKTALLCALPPGLTLSLVEHEKCQCEMFDSDPLLLHFIDSDRANGLVATYLERNP